MPPVADENPHPTETLVERTIVREQQYIAQLASSSVCAIGSGKIMYNCIHRCYIVVYKYWVYYLYESINTFVVQWTWNNVKVQLKGSSYIAIPFFSSLFGPWDSCALLLNLNGLLITMNYTHTHGSRLTTGSVRLFDTTLWREGERWTPIHQLVDYISHVPGSTPAYDM